MRHYTHLTIILLLALALTACGGKSDHGDRPVLTVTLEPLRYFTEAIAGDKFHVESMVPDGNSPETYDPTPQQLVALARSRAYLRIGYIGFERSWMEKLRENAPDMPVFDTSEGVELIYDDPVAAHEGHRHADGVEPHIWNSTRNARVIADNVFRALCQLDKANTAYYRQRLDSLNTVIERTDREIRALLPMAGSDAFLIYHPALSYFARDYGLTQLCIEDGGREPSPAHLKQLIARCREKRVKVIFVQQEFDRRNAELIARELGIRLAVIRPLSYHWEQEMISTAQELGR